MDYKKKFYKTINFFFGSVLISFALLAVVVLLGKQKEIGEFMSDINFLTLTAYADKSEENFNISVYSLLDAPIVISANDKDYIQIIGSFNEETDAMEGNSVITIESGYKGTILFGMNNYEPSNINLINENTSAISIKGSGENGAVKTYVALDGTLMISHNNNKEAPIISVDKGSTLYINDMKLDIVSEKTGTVIGSKNLMDSGNILFGKTNKGIISGGHIGAGMGGSYTGTILFEEGLSNFNVGSIGSDVKNTEELTKSTLIVYPSNNEYIDEIINIKNFDNYFILDNSKNIIFNEESVKKLTIDNGGNDKFIPYVDVSGEDMTYMLKTNQLFLNEKDKMNTLILIECNKVYEIIISEGVPIVKSSDTAEYKFFSENIIYSEDVNILLRGYEYSARVEVLKEPIPLNSGYTFMDAMEKGLKLRIINPSIEEAPNAQILEEVIILSENLDFIVVDEDGTQIDDGKSSFLLNNGEYKDVIVALRPGVGAGEYTTKIVINENKLGMNLTSSVEVVQVVDIGLGKIIFDTDGGGDIEPINGDEDLEVDLSLYLGSGEKTPKKSGYILVGWITDTGLVINKENPIYKMKIGDNKLRAKYIKVQNMLDISYNNHIKFYVSQGNIESLLEKSAITIKNKDNPLEERLFETSLDVSAVDFNNSGVYKAGILLLIDDVNVNLGKEVIVYVLKEPVIKSSEKIIIGKGDVETLNRVISGIKGKNYIVNEILNVIIEEEIKNVDIDYNGFNIDKIGNYEVNISMDYTGINGEKETIQRKVVLVVHGMEISDIK